MITLQNLELENFMNIKEAKLDLSNNINIITGRSGSGKSAVIDAIALCLSSKKRSNTYSEYVRQGATHSKVILNCLINKESVHFNLQINLVKGTPYQMELTYQSKVYKNTEAEIILKSLDIDYYSDIIFSMQTDGDITQLSPTQRANYLQRLLNFDFKHQKEQIINNLNTFTEQLNKIKNDVNLKIILLEKEESSKEQELQVKLTDEDISDYQLKISETQNMIAEYQKKHEQAEVHRKNINDLNSLILSIERENNTIINKLSLIEDNRKMHKQDEENLIKITADLTPLIEKVDKLKLNREKDLEDQQKTKTKLREYEQRISQLKEYITLYSRYASLEREEKCPMCGRETTDFLKEQLKLMTESDYDGTDARGHSFFDMFQIKKEAGDTFVDIEKKLANKLDLYQKEVSEVQFGYDLNEMRINEAIRDMIHFTSEVDIFTKRKEELEISINNLNNNFDESLDLDNLLKNNKSKINEYKNKIEEEDKLQSNFYDRSGNQLSELSNKVVEYNKIIIDHHNIVKQNKEIKLRNELRDNNIEKYKQELEQLKTENIEIINQQSIYEEALSVLDKTLPNYMIVKTCVSLQNEMNNFVQSIFPTYEIQLSNSKKGCEFFYTKDNTILEQVKKRNNAWINTRMSSGFEKSLLTTAFKVSLAELYGINVLLLDEICAASDDDSSIILYENILNRFDQVFIISHKEEVKNYIVDNFQNVTKYHTDNGKFEVVM